jgi:hypothetical protein
VRQFNARACVIKANPGLGIPSEGSVCDATGAKQTLQASGCANDSPSPPATPFKCPTLVVDSPDTKHHLRLMAWREG